MKEIKQDILDISQGAIVHQVNAGGAIGAGLAKQIVDRWPMVKRDYWENYRRGPCLGDYFVTKVGPKKFVASYFGQWTYGHRPNYCYTNYVAVNTALLRIGWYFNNTPIYIPHGMGCGLAGGDWAIVSGIIEQRIPEAIICKLDAAEQIELRI